MGANAQTTVPTFTASQVLTADQMNQSARTGVPVFADSTARDAAFGGSGEKTLAEGQLCYLENANVVQYYDGAAWATVGPSAPRIGQVVSTNKTDVFTTTSTSFVDVTGVSVTITPTLASSNVLVMVETVVGNSASGGGSSARINLLRGATNIAQSTGGGAGNQTLGVNTGSNNAGAPSSIIFLDSPATTSATTYKLQAAIISGGGTISIGRDSASANYPSHTTITAMEVLV
jgi:1,6-anhydro-N-acetylmuramate kinase